MERAVDFMLDPEIVRVRSIPMPLQRDPNGSIIHLALPVSLRPITSAPHTVFPNGSLLPIAPIVAS